MAIFNGYVKTVEVAVESSENAAVPGCSCSLDNLWQWATWSLMLYSPALVSLQLFIAVNVC